MDVDFRQLERSLYAPQTIRCPHCGHAEHEQWHKLAAVHVLGLLECAKAITNFHRPVNRNEMDLDRNANGNFAAMRWWGMIEPAPHDRWDITPKGWAFLRDGRRLPKHVLTLNGKAIGESIGLCSIRTFLDEPTWQKLDYQLHRHPHIPQLALSL